MQFSIGSVSALAALQGSKKSLQSDRFMVAEPDRALGATLGVWPWRLPTAAGAAGMGPAVGPGGLIDTKAYGKLKQFDGKEENWATWCFVARSYFTLLSQDFDHMLDLAENSPTGALAMAKLSEQGRIHARTFVPHLGTEHGRGLEGPGGCLPAAAGTRACSWASSAQTGRRARKPLSWKTWRTGKCWCAGTRTRQQTW